MSANVEETGGERGKEGYGETSDARRNSTRRVTALKRVHTGRVSSDAPFWYVVEATRHSKLNTNKA